MLKPFALARIKGLVAALALSFSGASWANCQLSVGWEPWEPYQFKKGDEVTGLDNDLVRAMADEAGCTLTFVQAPWKRQLEDIQRGKLDMTSAASHNAEREAFAYFSEPYRDETMVLLVRNGEAGKYEFSRFMDMVPAGFKLGVTRDYYYGEDFKEAMGKREFAILVSDVTADLQNFKKLEAGRIDGVLSDRFVSADIIRNNGLQGKFEVHPMLVTSSGVHLIFSKQSVNTEIVERFNKALAAIKANGTYDRILNKYLDSGAGSKE